MPEHCGRTFDEALLSGYVDGMLTQGDEQRVRVHVEDCAACRSVVDDMSQVKEVTMSSRFKMPVDDQWSEAPRGAASRLAFGVGWALVLVWGAVVAAFAVWEFWTSNEPVGDTLLVFAVVSGPVLLLLSVLIDRLKTLKTDRYREVQK
jgi:predicted anti-sigma-YlaC factor YlaD